MRWEPEVYRFCTSRKAPKVSLDTQTRQSFGSLVWQAQNTSLILILNKDSRYAIQRKYKTALDVQKVGGMDSDHHLTMKQEISTMPKSVFFAKRLPG
jgi:hypothetical protein